MGRDEANIRKKFLEGKLLSQNRRKLIKRDRETIERGMVFEHAFRFREQTGWAINIRSERSSKRKHTLCFYYGHGQTSSSNDIRGV